MKNFTRNSLLVVGSTVAAFGANAQVDTSSIETALLADIATVSAYGFTVLVAVLGASIGIKLVKKFTNKAS